MSYKGTRVNPHTPTSYHMMPYQNMALPMMNLVGWVGGNFEDSGCALSSTPILDSPFRFEQRTDKEPS